MHRMTQKRFIFLIIAAASSVPLCIGAAELKESLLGRWRNTDASTRWYQFVEFALRDGTPHVLLWGSQKKRLEDSADVDVPAGVPLEQLSFPREKPLVIKLDLGFKTEIITIRHADGVITCNAACEYKDPARKGYTITQKLVRAR